MNFEIFEKELSEIGLGMRKINVNTSAEEVVQKIIKESYSMGRDVLLKEILEIPDFVMMRDHQQYAKFLSISDPNALKLLKLAEGAISYDYRYIGGHIGDYRLNIFVNKGVIIKTLKNNEEMEKELGKLLDPNYPLKRVFDATMTMKLNEQMGVALSLMHTPDVHKKIRNALEDATTKSMKKGK